MRGWDLGLAQGDCPEQAPGDLDQPGLVGTRGHGQMPRDHPGSHRSSGIWGPDPAASCFPSCLFFVASGCGVASGGCGRQRHIAASVLV